MEKCCKGVISESAKKCCKGVISESAMVTVCIVEQ